LRSSIAASVVWIGLELAGCASWRPPVLVATEHAGPIRSRDVVLGERVFTTVCAACHAGRVNPAGYHWTPAQMRHQIREGNALMPALRASRVSAGQVEAVLAYLRTIDAIDGALPPDPLELGDDTEWQLDAARARRRPRPALAGGPAAAAGVEHPRSDAIAGSVALGRGVLSPARALDAP
jgi:mono/diheme cytochrome c family protein